MSKMYRIRIAGVEVDLHLDRSIHLTVDLLPILGQEAMTGLLLKQLAAAGAREQDGKWLLTGQISDWIFDPATLKLEVRPHQRQQLQEVELAVFEESLSRSFLRQHGAQELIELDAAEIRANSELGEALAQELARQAGENDLASRRFFEDVRQARQLINQSLKQVYREAVAEKARSLGKIVSLSESESQGELRIRLEVQD